MLELEEEEGLPDGNADYEPGHPRTTVGNASAEDYANSEELPGVDGELSIPEDLPVDTSWDDVYESTMPAVFTRRAGSSGEGRRFGLEFRRARQHNRVAAGSSALAAESDTNERGGRLIATTIIDAIDTDGMLTIGIDDILASLNSASDPEAIDAAEVEAVLKRIQQFDPTGIAARDLPECLALQLRQLPADVPWRDEALTLVSYSSGSARCA